MAKKVLLTGATGFIGRVLLSYLKVDDSIDHIVCIDNLLNSSFDLRDPLFKSSKIQMNISSVLEFHSEELFDEIYHLASPVGPVGVLKWAGHMGPMIVADTYKMAQYAIRSGGKLIDISTSEVYGKDPAGIPQKEELAKVVPSEITVRLEYGVSKLLCEIFLINMVRKEGLKCNIVRPYNIVSFGQQSAAGFVLPRFIEQALAGDSLTVYPPGSQRRTFTHVKDFVEGILSVMAEGKNGEIYNIGNPENLYSIIELAKRVIERTNSASKIKIIDPVTLHGELFAEAWEKIPNIDKIQRDTGWVPTINFETIINEAIEGYTNV